MAEQCTIFAPLDDFARVSCVLSGIASEVAETRTDPGELIRIVVRSDDHTLTLNRLVRVQPGDKFSQIVLGSGTFVRGITTDNAARKQALSSFLLRTQLIIGVVGEPDFDDPSGLFDDCIEQTAQLLGGLVFNGDSFLDAAGYRVLDSDGFWDPETAFQ